MTPVQVDSSKLTHHPSFVSFLSVLQARLDLESVRPNLSTAIWCWNKSEQRFRFTLTLPSVPWTAWCDLRAGLHRHRREVLLLRQEIHQGIRNELKDTVTAVLLSCEIALQVPNLPSAAEIKMRSVRDLAQEVRVKLGSP